MFKKERRQSPEYAQCLLKRIWELANTPIRIMEVCGTHTMAIARSGIKQLLPKTITLLSGPGCPVCVTAENDIDLVSALACRSNVIVATYGDMMRVPGNNGSLMSARLCGADVRVIYSSTDALRLAKDNPMHEIVLLGVGFETTIPTTAITLAIAIKERVENFSVLSFYKAVPPILSFLLSDPETYIDAFLLPGNVCAISGTEVFNFIVKEHLRPCVVAGFDPVDILEAVYMLLLQQQSNQARMEIQYRAVREQGNIVARQYVGKYFHLADCTWRGIGVVPLSGYIVNDVYSSWDTCKKLGIYLQPSTFKRCVCGEILKGRKQPDQCELFATSCTPATPKGPCMVSEEGSCAAYYWFNYTLKGE